MPQALYFYHAKASFVEKDLHIFQKRFDVIKEFAHPRQQKIPWRGDFLLMD